MRTLMAVAQPIQGGGRLDRLYTFSYTDAVSIGHRFPTVRSTEMETLHSSAAAGERYSWGFICPPRDFRHPSVAYVAGPWCYLRSSQAEPASLNLAKIRYGTYRLPSSEKWRVTLPANQVPSLGQVRSVLTNSFSLLCPGAMLGLQVR